MLNRFLSNKNDTLLSYIVVGKNDNYGGNFNDRLFRTLRYNCNKLKNRGVKFELIFVEWNPIEDRPYLSPVFKTNFPDSRCYVVGKDIHDNIVQEYKYMTFMEFFAKNVGIKRAKGDFILTSNADVFFSNEVFDALTKKLDDNTFYRAVRCDIDLPRVKHNNDNEFERSVIRVNACDEIPYTNASGDFILASKKLYMKATGFDEQQRFVKMHKDSRLLYSSQHFNAGVKYELIGRIYHIEHGNSLTVTGNSADKYRKANGPLQWKYYHNLPYKNEDNWGLDQKYFTEIEIKPDIYKLIEIKKVIYKDDTEYKEDKGTVSVIGVGRLGLCFALNLEKKGYKVIGVDVNQDYVDSLNNKTFSSNEDGVNDLLQGSKRFEATTNIAKSLLSDTIFIVVATPSLPDGRYDHSSINTVTESLMKLGKQPKKKNLIVMATVMPEYCDKLQKRVEEYNYDVSYNPEFIAQGTIVKDQLEPDLILIGSRNDDVFEKIITIYGNLCNNTPHVAQMSPLSAEIAKIALNCYITTKITFANIIGDLAIKAGAEKEKILKAIGSDSRIGNKCFKYGFGYGGVCLPRDNVALIKYAKNKGIEFRLGKATDRLNKEHLDNQVEDFVKNNPKDVPVTITEVTYKKGTNIIEKSKQLLFAVRLADLGYDITIKTNKDVINQVKELYGDKFKYNLNVLE